MSKKKLKIDKNGKSKDLTKNDILQGFSLDVVYSTLISKSPESKGSQVGKNLRKMEQEIGKLLICEPLFDYGTERDFKNICILGIFFGLQCGFFELGNNEVVVSKDSEHIKYIQNELVYLKSKTQEEYDYTILDVFVFELPMGIVRENTVNRFSQDMIGLRQMIQTIVGNLKVEPVINPVSKEIFNTLVFIGIYFGLKIGYFSFEDGNLIISHQQEHREFIFLKQSSVCESGRSLR